MSKEPKSIRLTNDLRDTFINKVVATYYDDNAAPEEIDLTRQESNTLVDRITDPYKEVLGLMPSWAVMQAEELRIRAKKRYDANFSFDLDLPLGTKIDWFPDKEGSYYRQQGAKAQVVYEDHPELQKLYKAKEKRRNWRSARDEFRGMLKKLTYSVNSTRQLYRAWPDAIKFQDVFPHPEETGTGDRRSKTVPAVSAIEIEMAAKLGNINISDAVDER